jgi:chromosome segregation ATPase
MSENKNPKIVKQPNTIAYIALIVALASGGGVVTAEVLESQTVLTEIPDHTHSLVTHSHEMPFHEHDLQSHTHPVPEPFDPTELEAKIADLQAQIDSQTFEISDISEDQIINTVRQSIEEELEEITEVHDKDDDRLHTIIDNNQDEYDDRFDELNDEQKEQNKRLDSIEEDIITIEDVIEELQLTITEIQTDIDNIFSSLFAICERYKWKCEELAEEFGWN